MADELSDFRHSWLKELRRHQKTDQKPGTSAKSKSERDSALDADNKPQPPDDSAGQPSLRDGGASDNDQPASLQQDQFVDNDNRLLQGQICGENQSESSATYYPFRILTTLLNRASTEEGPKLRRKTSSSRSLPDEKTTPPKRTYFSASDGSGLGKDTPKKVKKEDVKREPVEEGQDRKDYLDLFIADLVSDNFTLWVLSCFLRFPEYGEEEGLEKICCCEKLAY